MRNLVGIIAFLFMVTAAWGSNYTDSLKNVLKSEKISDKEKSVIYGNLAWEYAFINLDSAFIFGTAELLISEKNNFVSQQGDALNTLGMISRMRGDYRSSLDYYQKCLKIYYKTKDTISMAALYNNIGIIYQFQKNYELALSYHTKGLNYYKKTDNQTGIANSYTNLGLTEGYLKNFGKAEDYYQKSIDIKTEIADPRGLSNAYVNLGALYWDQRLYEKAEKAFEKALMYTKESEDVYAYNVVLGNLGQAKIYKGDLKEGIRFCEEAYRFAEGNSLNDILITACDCLHLGYKKSGDEGKALHYLEKLSVYKDSVHDEQLANDIAMKEAQFEYSLKYSKDSVERAQERKLAEVDSKKKEAEIEKRQIVLYAMFGGVAILLVFLYFIYSRFKITQKQKNIIEEKEKETQLQKQIIEEKQKEIIDSINYAHRLQQAILAPESEIKKYFSESFLLYKPKDIVAGDFYFFEVTATHIFYAAADCTGHGVPGAMVSIVCSNALTRCVKEFMLTDPGKILDKTRELILETFMKSGQDVKDGMDISLCSFQLSNGKIAEVKYAGANNPIWYVENDELKEIKGNKQPIGKTENPLPFTTHLLPDSVNTLFLLTDGYADQFGGPKGKKFKYANLQKLILENADKEMNTQSQILNLKFEEWKGDLEQVDDVCVIGIRIGEKTFVHTS